VFTTRIRKARAASPMPYVSRKPFVEGEKICVVLGDNIIEHNIIASKQTFEKQERGAHIILKEVPDPERFGCPEIVNGQILGIEEEPRPIVKVCRYGIYFYDQRVFPQCKNLSVDDLRATESSGSGTSSR